MPPRVAIKPKQEDFFRLYCLGESILHDIHLFMLMGSLAKEINEKPQPLPYVCGTLQSKCKRTAIIDLHTYCEGLEMIGEDLADRGVLYPRPVEMAVMELIRMDAASFKDMRDEDLHFKAPKQPDPLYVKDFSKIARIVKRLTQWISKEHAFRVHNVGFHSDDVGEALSRETDFMFGIKRIEKGVWRRRPSTSGRYLNGDSRSPFYAAVREGVKSGRLSLEIVKEIVRRGG